uniref:Putative secreted protein n=1 Tax=Ixodes ricinus TaxID=34613 RepID=A0A6B0U7M6_IXORI
MLPYHSAPLFKGFAVLVGLPLLQEVTGKNSWFEYYVLHRQAHTLHCPHQESDQNLNDHWKLEATSGKTAVRAGSKAHEVVCS